MVPGGTQLPTRFLQTICFIPLTVLVNHRYQEMGIYLPLDFLFNFLKSPQILSLPLLLFTTTIGLIQSACLVSLSTPLSTKSQILLDISFRNAKGTGLSLLINIYILLSASNYNNNNSWTLFFQFVTHSVLHLPYFSSTPQFS